MAATNLHGPGAGDLDELGRAAERDSETLYAESRRWDDYVTSYRKGLTRRLIQLGMPEPEAEVSARALTARMNEVVTGLREAAQALAALPPTADQITDDATRAYGRPVKVSLRAAG